MKKTLLQITACITILGLMIVVAATGNRIVTVLSEHAPIENKKYIIIDPGHGGEDGGATSCSGVLESSINLEISLRLNELMHLLGIHTIMIRTDDRSVYTEGESIAAKKVSDLKERVRLCNSTPNAILISIHQNYFQDKQYHGAQVFFAPSAQSKELAQRLQANLISTVNQGSRRNIKRADGIYLLEKVKCPAILVECGFLSNPEEEAQLRSSEYQEKVCCVIAATVSQYLSNT